MHISGEAFAQACHDQGVELGQPLVSFINRPRGEELPLRRLVSFAGRLLAQNRDCQLAGDLLEEPIHHGFAPSRILQRIINASIEHEDGGPLAFKCAVDTLANVCSAAEPAFARAFRDMADGRMTGPSVRYGGALYVDSHGQAFAFTKSDGYTSTIALRDVYICGVPYPAGSILYIERDGFIPAYDRPHKRFTIHAEDEITAINFARLSAFASPPDQRNECHNEDTYIEAGDAAYDFLSTANIATIQSLSQSVVSANAYQIRNE